MRDLAEATHINFIKRSRYYYRDNGVGYEIKEKDYINFIDNYIANKKASYSFKNPWTYIHFSNSNWMPNTWKIHISATYQNHIEILRIVAKYAISKELNFKFCTNIDQFISINSKTISRASSGKFIVLYPIEKEFEQTLEDLYNLLEKYDGPYILSDRPYKDSKTVYYRYGEINPIRFMDGYGTITTRMLDNHNQLISDERVPFFKIPDFVEDKIYKDHGYQKSKLLQKYSIKESLHFSAQGGVYLGEYDNKDYVIKEARKYAGLDTNFKYATERLKKEYSTIKFLSNLDCVPTVVEMIEEFGNVYLVEELISGKNLSNFPFSNSPLIKRDYEAKEKFNDDLMNIVALSLKAISQIHNTGIILNDVSPNNLMFDSEKESIYFIDLESSYHIVDDLNKIHMFTHGFVSEGDYSLEKHDLHKLALVFMYCIMPFNKIFMLSPEKKIEALKVFEKLDVVDINIIKTIEGLIKYDFDNAEEALKCLNSNNISIIENNKKQNIALDIENIQNIKRTIISNINSSDSNHMVATDPMAFITNKYSFAFGIFGVLYSLKKINTEGNVDDHKIQEIVNRFMVDFYRNPVGFSNGLFVGLSGVVVGLAELGYVNEASIVMEGLSYKKIEMMDLAYGVSGKIIALIKLYKISSDEKYLMMAMKDAEKIEKAAIVKDGLYYWKDECEDIYTGLTRGSSGVALTFLYLFLETQDRKYLDVGIKALEADLTKLIKNDEGYISFNSYPEGEENTIYSPYIHNGIAGLGCVLLRYYLITGNEKYGLLLDEIIEACDANISLFSGYLRGMSGVMTFLQDCYIYSNSEYAHGILMNMTNYIDFFQVSIDEIHGYAGDELYRISHDLFTGSAGVILTLKRSLSLSDKEPNHFLILDEYYDNSFKKN